MVFNRINTFREKNDSFAVLKTCEEIVNFWKDCQYGIINNGELCRNNSPTFFQNNWHLLSPKEFKNYRCGICYDYTTWAAQYLLSNYITYYQYYIYMSTPNEDTHTFLLIPYNDQYIYIEGAFKDLAEKINGIKMFKTKRLAFNYIVDKLNTFYSDYQEYTTMQYAIWEYYGHPEYGCNALRFTRYVTEGQPKFEGTVLHK